MIKLNEKGYVDARELHTALEIKTRFSAWIEEIIDRCGFEVDKDFFRKTGKSNGGRPLIEYEFKLDVAKEACLVIKSSKSSDMRKYLIGLSNKVDSGLLVSREQIKSIMQMIKVFSIYEYRALAREKNCSNYIDKAIMINPSITRDSGFIYGQFNNWRSEALKLGKEVLTQRVKEYCLIEQKRIPNKFTQDEALVLMGEYEMIRNAIWDLLSSKNKSEEMINNICLIAGDLAKELKPYLQRLNESDIFFQKLEANEIKAIGL